VLESAGGVRGEQARDALLAGRGLAAEAELAVDHGASERAFGVVVGRLDTGVAGERPQRGPGFEQVARHAAAVLVARAFAGVAADDRFELALELADLELEFAAVAGVLVDLSDPEDPLAQALAVLAELFLGAHAFGVRFEVTREVSPTDLAASEREMAIGPPAV
jgi:hypothetical protein